MSEPDHAQIAAEFHAAVNMTAAELEKWLAGEESQAVGWHHDGESEAIGHQEGRRLIQILRKKKTELSDDDYTHMRKAVGYVHRHLAQGGPAEHKNHSRWRYSLMNWGHDPLKR